MKKISLLFIILFLNIEVVMSQDAKSLLFGKWINYYNTKKYLLFDSDSFKIANNSFEFSQTWELEKPGVFKTQTEFNKTPIQYYYYLFDNFMVILTMKHNLEQVDEVSLFVKDQFLKLPTIKNSKIDFLINSYTPGLYMVLLPNFQRYNSKLDILESREIVVDRSFVESSMLITPLDYALKNFAFYLNEIELPFFLDSELSSEIFKNKLIQNEDIIVCVYGFNQIGRETVNYEMNKRIDGDILMFYIGKYKDFETFPTSLDFQNDEL